MDVELRVFYAALVRDAAGELAVVVEEIPVVANLHNGVVRRPAEHRLHDASLVGEGAVRLLALGVAQIVRGAGRVGEVVFAVKLVHPGTLEVSAVSVYHSNFINSLIRNDVLLIIGYGFGDNYLNYLLGSYDRWGKKTTILVSPTTDEALFAEVKSKGKQMGGCHIYGNYVWFDCTFAEACKKGLMEFIKDHTSTKFRKELASALRVAYKNSWK